MLDLFEKFAPIKDIRMIRNKMTGGNKDFAFVEFFQRPGEIEGHSSFPFCSLTLLELDIVKSPIYQAKCRSHQNVLTIF